MAHAAAACAYLPMPGLGFLLPWLRRDDRLVRFHGWQGGVVVLAGYALVAGAGALDQAFGLPAVVAATVVAFLASLGWLAAQALRGRYARVRGAWDLLAWLGRLHALPTRTS